MCDDNKVHYTLFYFFLFGEFAVIIRICTLQCNRNRHFLRNYMCMQCFISGLSILLISDKMDS